MLLADVVETSTNVSSTRSRLAKIDALASLLSRVPPDEIVAATGYLVGDAPQGRIGIGWASLRDLDAENDGAPMLTIADVSNTIDAVRDATGPGSVRARRDLLDCVVRTGHAR